MTQMRAPKFSIIIPTRNRADTLYYTLQTCLVQSFKDYEIIVCDNNSTDNTRNILEHFNDPRIKYYNTGKSLAMRDNWELAVSKAGGEFITVLGDDDGLNPHAFTYLNKLLDIFGNNVIRWEWAQYYWPNVNLPSVNKLCVPITNRIKFVDSKKMIKKVLNGQSNYHKLPTVYNSIVYRDILALLKEKSGRVFKSESPDVYSGFVISYVVKNYISVSYPISIAGISIKSNGMINISGMKDEIGIKKDFYNLNREAGILWHSGVPKIPLLAATVADSFLHAKDSLFIDDPDLTFNQKQFIVNSFQELSYNKKDDVNEIIHEIKETMSDPELRNFIESEKSTLLTKEVMWKGKIFIQSLLGKQIILDVKNYKINNIFEVANFISKLKISCQVNLRYQYSKVSIAYLIAIIKDIIRYYRIKIKIQELKN
jgi:glycosyltransferase involved in cell wall biosynthesis